MTRKGMAYEKAIPAKTPVTIEAAPNMAAIEAYMGSTHLQKD